MDGNWEVESIDPIGKPVRNIYNGRVPSTSSRFAVRAVDATDRKRKRDMGIRLVIAEDGKKSVYREDPSYEAGVIRIHCTRPTIGTTKANGHGGLNTRFGKKVFEAIQSME